MRWRHRRSPEKVLLDDLGRAKFLANHQGEAFVGVDEHQNIILFSTEAEDLLGWMQEEVLGRPMSLIQPERYRRRHSDGFQRIRREGVEGLRVLFEDTHFEALRKDRTEVPVAISTAAWRSPQGTLYFLAALRKEERS